MKALLQDAIDDYLAFRRSQGKAARTVTNDAQCLRRLLTHTGNIYVENISERHISDFMGRSMATRPRSANLDHTNLNQFFAWARNTKRAPRTSDPMFGRGAMKLMPREKQRIESHLFPSLLDAAENHHPRDRIIVALGLYLFPRASEIRSMLIRHASLDSGEVYIKVHKTRKDDYMPISEELDGELRKWLTYYSRTTGSLQPEWFLVPGKTQARFSCPPGESRLRKVAEPRLSPTRPVRRIEDVVKRAMEDIGFQVRMPNGQSLGEGMHTLRRSGARAHHDALQAAGVPNPIRIVQAMLHHSSQLQTEIYLGLQADRMARNDLVKGKRMYPRDESNVVRLERAASSGASSGVSRVL